MYLHEIKNYLNHLETVFLMKRIFVVIIISLTCFQSIAQIRVPVKIDTSQHSTLRLYKFMQSYMQQDTISREMWHPKYKDKIVYDYTMDWLWSSKSPKKFSALFELELAELQKVNDTLSYVKILAKSKPEKLHEDFSNVYKFYIVEINGKYYLDNCKEYDTGRFKKQETKNINFYISPFYTIDKKAMNDASEQLETLYVKLNRPRLKKRIDYYLCSTEEELNNLSNIIIWDGGLSGYTNIPEGFIVAINNNPVYNHEFVHAILGSSANCFFLQEGIAALYGGMDKGAKSYEKGIEELKSCYTTGQCNFDNLYAREVKQTYSSSLTYTFAAAFCKYLIDNYGLNYFYKLYYNREITTENFMEKISKTTGKSQAEIRKGVEKLILQN